VNPAVKTARPYRATLRQEQARQTRLRILRSARQLLVDKGYGQITMQQVAREAGVAYQTVYAQFGTKLRLAMEVCDADLQHVAGALALVDKSGLDDRPVVVLRTIAAMARRLYEPCADLLRSMRESGDAELIRRFKQIERRRHELVAAALVQPLAHPAGRRPEFSVAERIDVVWTLAGPETYEQLVLDRHWSPERYEQWLGEALTGVVGARRLDGGR
jgi:AcrR family transcriptional regulator